MTQGLSRDYGSRAAAAGTRANDGGRKIRLKVRLPVRLLNTSPSLSLPDCAREAAAKAIIPEGAEVFIRSGSTIHLSCVITGSGSPDASPPNFVFWYRDGNVLNFDYPRGRMRVTTDKGETTVSRLLIARARPADAGDYACKPSHTEPANTTVHIVSFAGQSHVRHTSLLLR